MHIETLKTFCDLVELGSLSRAAKLNRVTQSAVSQQLRALETRYGRRLMERAPRAGAQPTAAGRLFYQELKQLLERFSELERRLREDADTVSGSVRVAAVYSVGLHTLPPALKQALVAYPALNLRLEYRRTDQIYEACLAGEIDFGIVAQPAKRSQVEIAPLGKDELVFVAAPDNALLRKKRLRLADLDGQPFVAFDRDIPTRKLLDRLLRHAGAGVSYVMELDNIETIKRVVEIGAGIAIVPEPTIKQEVKSRTLCAVHISDETLMRPLGIVHRQGRHFSPAVERFIAELR